MCFGIHFASPRAYVAEEFWSKPIYVLCPVLSTKSGKNKQTKKTKPQTYKGVFKYWWEVCRLRTALPAYYLITIARKTATLHGTWVKVPLVVKLEDRQSAVDVVEDRGKAPTQCQQLGSIAVEPDTHGTLKGEVSTIAQQRTGKRRRKHVRWATQMNWTA